MFLTFISRLNPFSPTGVPSWRVYDHFSVKTRKTREMDTEPLRWTYVHFVHFMTNFMFFGTKMT